EANAGSAPTAEVRGPDPLCSLLDRCACDSVGSAPRPCYRANPARLPAVPGWQDPRHPVRPSGIPALSREAEAGGRSGLACWSPRGRRYRPGAQTLERGPTGDRRPLVQHPDKAADRPLAPRPVLLEVPEEHAQLLGLLARPHAEVAVGQVPAAVEDPVHDRVLAASRKVGLARHVHADELRGVRLGTGDVVQAADGVRAAATVVGAADGERPRAAQTVAHAPGTVLDDVRAAVDLEQVAAEPSRPALPGSGARHEDTEPYPGRVPLTPEELVRRLCAALVRAAHGRAAIRRRCRAGGVLTLELANVYRLGLVFVGTVRHRTHQVVDHAIGVDRRVDVVTGAGGGHEHGRLGQDRPLVGQRDLLAAGGDEPQ